MNSTILLREVDGAAADVFDLGRLDRAAAAAGPRREVYRKSLHDLRADVDGDAAVELARWIRRYVRENREFPHASAVRQHEAAIRRGTDESADDPGADGGAALRYRGSE